MKVVISQPMFVPWLGLFEQIKLSDVYVHYDDVQMPQGCNFMHRVQLRTEQGQRWLSAQIDRKNSGKMINKVMFSQDNSWKKNHLINLHNTYKNMPFFNEMIELAEEIYTYETNKLCLFNANTIEIITKWLEIEVKFVCSSQINVKGASSEKLLNICNYFRADEYITGLGALNYLNHSIFKENKIDVSYMKYKMLPYKQPFVGFIPYVTILDAIACNGKDTLNLMRSGTVCSRGLTDESN